MFETQHYDLAISTLDYIWLSDNLRIIILKDNTARPPASTIMWTHQETTTCNMRNTTESLPLPISHYQAGYVWKLSSWRGKGWWWRWRWCWSGVSGRPALAVDFQETGGVTWRAVWRAESSAVRAEGAEPGHRPHLAWILQLTGQQGSELRDQQIVLTSSLQTGEHSRQPQLAINNRKCPKSPIY